MVFGSGNKFRIKRSQSKASYLSAYKREPREREKGLPNFEGSYKRTASPNSDGRAGDAAVAVEEPLQDVENVAPAAEGGNVSDSSRGDGVRLLQQSPRENLQLHNCTATSQPSQPQQQQQQQQQSLPSKQQQQQQQPQQPTEVHSSPAVLAERPTAMVEQQQQQQSKTLPRANNSAGQDFKRSSRAPRAQSDPSNMPNKADAAIACTLHDMMMMPPSSRHSESASSLLQQKRSQSDLSHMGSTESGYSSLSLNAPSPSHSPTRLSSGDFAGPPPPPPAPPMHPHPRCAGDSSYHHAPAGATPAVGGHVPEPAAWRRPVSLSCSTASSSDVVPKREQPPVPRGHMSPEEIECEELSRDLVSHLSPSDKLLNILAPGPDVKRSTDYVSPLFRMDLAPRSRTSVAEKLLESIGINGSEHNDVICSSNSSGLSPNSSYYTTSEPKAKLLNHFSRQRLPLQLECNGIGTLQKKKADLVSRLDRKLKVLRDEQVALAEETAVNETLGVLVADRVKYVAKPQEANKFRTHVQEVGHITSLLLSLSGRLARAENALLGLQVVDHPEKKALEEKKSKLTCQLEEAKELKDNIDRRGEFVSATLGRYLSEDEYSDYDHFIAMKAKLLIDAREIADKIQLGEEQLRALKETLEDF